VSPAGKSFRFVRASERAGRSCIGEREVFRSCIREPREIHAKECPLYQEFTQKMLLCLTRTYVTKTFHGKRPRDLLASNRICMLKTAVLNVLCLYLLLYVLHCLPGTRVHKDLQMCVYVLFMLYARIYIYMYMPHMGHADHTTPHATQQSMVTRNPRAC